MHVCKERKSCSGLFFSNTKPKNDIKQKTFFLNIDRNTCKLLFLAMRAIYPVSFFFFFLHGIVLRSFLLYRLGNSRFVNVEYYVGQKILRCLLTMKKPKVNLFVYPVSFVVFIFIFCLFSVDGGQTFM